MLCPDCQGMDRRVLQQAASLQQNGYRITLLCGFECPKEEHYVYNGIEIHRYRFDWDDERLKRLRARLPNHDRLRQLLNRGFMLVARRFLRFNPFDTFILGCAARFSADVVHVHDLPLLRLGSHLARRWGAKLVYDAHEIYYEQECLSYRQRDSLFRQERDAISRVDLFTTVNPAIADYFASRHRRRPLVLFNSAVTPPAGFDHDSRRLLRTRAGLPPDALVVLFQGWFSAERNLTTLVRMAQHFPASTYLCLIGYGAHEKDLRAIVAGLPWADRVRFLGQVAPDHLMPLTAGADIGVIPYLAVDLNHELCSPNKFFEYLQAGVPIVAQDLVFFRLMAQRWGVVRTGDLATPSGMASAVLQTLQDVSCLAAMKANCHTAARTLCWEVEAEKLLAAYADMLGRR